MTKKKILVVDDEAEIVKALQIKLEVSGYEVLIAYDGEEGLERVRKEKPDLLILDLILPEVGGYKVCDLLKADARYDKIPIIMLTAKTQEEDIWVGEEVGADAYITKPFEYQVLLSEIKKLLKD